MAEQATQASARNGRQGIMSSPAIRRFFRNRMAVVGLVIIVVLVLVAIFAPLLSPAPPAAQNLRERLQPPSATHWFGTDEYGRSVFSRVVHGARVSLLTGTIPVLVAGVIGTLLGLFAGFYRGWVDNVLMRVMDVLLAFPSILLALAIVGALGPGLTNAVIAVAIVSIPEYARIVRSVVLGTREEEFVQAASAVGVRTPRKMFVHILPSALGPLSVQASLGVGFAILSLAGLSFLGLGIQPPAADWGEMLNRGRQFLPDADWLLLFPGLAISFTVLGFNLLGDGIRDALDPRD